MGAGVIGFGGDKPLFLSTEAMHQHNDTAYGGPPRKVQGMLCLCRTSAGSVWKGSSRQHFHPTLYLEVQQARRNSARTRHKLSFSSPLADRAGFC